MRQVLFLLALSFLVVEPTSAQSTGISDSLWLLPQVEVKQSRWQALGLGHQIQQVDTSTLADYPMQDLATVLSRESAIYLKNYGPGRLNTTSIRGASASQTVLTWNGIPLVQPMLGQFDLSLFPAFFLDEIAIQPGGGSSNWGSGAIGGSLHFNHQLSFDQGWQINWQSLVGSFGHFNNGLKLQYSNARWSNTTRVFYESAQNDFPYLDFDGSKKRLPNSELRQQGLLQETALRISDQQQLSLRLWWQNSDRDIPPILGQSLSLAQQEDRTVRALLDWTYFSQRSVWKIQTAYFDEQLDYQDELANLNSESHGRTTQLRVEWKRHLSPRWQIDANAQQQWLWARSSGYANSRRQQQRAIYTALKWRPHPRWTSLLSLRQEWVDEEAVPFVPSLGVEGQLGQRFRLKGNVSRNFRLPTFNDLYWAEGGNPDLQPERGWSQELTLDFQTLSTQRQATLTIYNRNIQNWIIWLPGSIYWSPENVLEVWSRGLEIQSRQSFAIRSITGQIDAQYQFVLSTNQKTKSTADASLGKQLIYQPRHQAQINLSVAWRQFRLRYQHAYTGQVYILADHSAALPHFHIGDCHWSYAFRAKQWRGQIQFGIRNLWNKNYQVVVSRPLPGRSYELSSSFYFQSKN
ncbi:MAG: TonB-dependent receptor [Bacteroidota bacterium]